MNYELLKWDSDFFSLPVGKISNRNFSKEEFYQLLQNAKTNKIRLLYWFTMPENSQQQIIATQNGGLLVDEKITYYKNIKSIHKDSVHPNIRSYDTEQPDDELISLALQSA
jgi:hypothetical protein